MSATCDDVNFCDFCFHYGHLQNYYCNRPRIYRRISESSKATPWLQRSGLHSHWATNCYGVTRRHHDLTIATALFAFWTPSRIGRSARRRGTLNSSMVCSLSTKRETDSSAPTSSSSFCADVRTLSSMALSNDAGLGIPDATVELGGLVCPPLQRRLRIYRPIPPLVSLAPWRHRQISGLRSALVLG